MEETKSYRIRTTVNGDAPSVVNVNLNQTYDMFEILSLKLGQDKVYKLYQSDYGIVVGRVLANKGFGIPNAKVSIFIPNESEDQSSLDWSLYPFMSVNSWAPSGTKYNLLPDEKQSECHQNVGTFPNKKLLLDNNDVIEVFDKYWKYTTVTNNAGDYMLYGIPTGTQQLHVDVDLSDIGVLSQKPRDMIYKGYDINTFDSPNKFKKSTTLESLPQIKSQDMGVYVYPFWGDTTDNGPIAITRCDINIDYTFEPTCVFMGSVITDSGSNAIGKNCRAFKRNGRMDELVSGEGTIEMIRKTFTGKVEEVKIQGGRVIDSDGVWCYQIPMNLDYVVTDEFGNLVPSDNPEIGIPTRTRVRFRVTLDDTINDATARKRAKYLVPNNPRVNSDNPSFSATLEPDYEFGTQTKDESFRDLFWNNVYTVKNYIPRLQKNKKTSDKWHTGIKWVNHYGDNNPMPYNSLRINLTFTYRFICILAKVFVNLIEILNRIIGILLEPFCLICKFLRGIGSIPIIGWAFKGLAALFCAVTEFKCIGVPKEFCEDGNVKYAFYPGCDMNDCMWKKTKKVHAEDEAKENCQEHNTCTKATRDKDPLYNCLENQLAQDNDVTSFNFTNDWINGTLYMPLWFRKITPKRKYLFGLIKIKAKDRWCSAEKEASNFRIYQPCALKRTSKNSVTLYNGKTAAAYNKLPNNECTDNNCHDKEYKDIKINKGVIQPKQTILDETVYYYRPVEFDKILNTGIYKTKPDVDGVDNNGEVKLLFATDIVLLGSLNDCDLHCTPQFFKNLDSSTYTMPEDLLLTDTIATPVISIKGGRTTARDDNDYEITYDFQSQTEMTGADWGNNNTLDQCGKAKDGDGGVFYSIGCSTIETKRKSCVNLERACEFGVTTDETMPVDVFAKENDEPVNVSGTLIPDGFISYDELYNIDARGMFATLNGNNLKTKRNKNGFLEYDFRYLYPDNFDGSMYDIMRERQRKCDKSYAKNYALELYSEDYYHFRLGDEPYFYTSPTDPTARLARYENSFYFYFGLKKGSTAIEKFNSQFFSDCTDVDGEYTPINITPIGNSICSETSSDPTEHPIEPDGNIMINVTGIDTPYTITMRDERDTEYRIGYIENNNVIYDITEENIKIIAGCQRDGKYYAYDNGNNCINITNGTYDMVFEDSSANITEATIQMGDNEISFSVDSMAFGLKNEDAQLSECTLIAWANDRESPTGLGGIVIIDDLCAAVTGESGRFKITLSKDDCDNSIAFYVTIYKVTDGSNSYFKADITDNTYARLVREKVINNELVTEVVAGNITDTVANIKVYIGAWYGDATYIVDVIEMCDEDESDRRGSKTITVEQPIPFKMFINGIDYDMIKDWKSGYKYEDGRFSGSGIPLSGWNEIATTGLEGLSEVKLSDWENGNNNTYNVYSKLEMENDGTSPYKWGANAEAYVYSEPNDIGILNTGEIIVVNKQNLTSLIAVIPDNCAYSCVITKEQFNNYEDFYLMITTVREQNTVFGDNAYFLFDSTYPDTVIFNDNCVSICFNNPDALRIEMASTYMGSTPFMTEEQFDNIDINEINQETISNIRTDAKNVFRTCADSGLETDTYRDSERENGEIYGLKPKVYYCEPPTENPTGEQSTTLVLQYFEDDVDALDTIEGFLGAYGIVSYRTELTGTTVYCGSLIYSNNEIDLRYDVVDDLNDIYNNRLDLVTLTKEAFWKMCENDDKSIMLTYQTNSTPVKYRIDYKGEVEDEDTGIRYVDNHVTSNKTSNYVSDIEIPSLTRTDNYPYNNTGKPPYAVAIENIRKQKLPTDFTYNEETNTVRNMFLTHIVDKVLSVDYFMWAAKRIPLSSNNHTVFYGYMHGNIHNGILNKDGKFMMQTIGDNEVRFITTNSENALPTVREITGIYTEVPTYDQWNKPWFGCTPDGYTWVMPYGEIEMTVSDEYCTYSQPLYSNMTIVVEDSSAMSADEGHTYGGWSNFLKVKAINCDEDKVEYFLIWRKYDESTAHYNYLPYAIGDYRDPTESDPGRNFINTDDSTFYNSLPEIYTKNYSYFPGKGYITTNSYATVFGVDYNSETDTYEADYVNLSNRSNCGLFTGGFEPNQGNYYYVVAICDKHCAVVSDVLDFSGRYMIRVYMHKDNKIGLVTRLGWTRKALRRYIHDYASSLSSDTQKDAKIRDFLRDLFAVEVVWGYGRYYIEKNERVDLLFKVNPNSEYNIQPEFVDQNGNTVTELVGYNLPLDSNLKLVYIDIDAYLEQFAGNDYINGKCDYVVNNTDSVVDVIFLIVLGIENIGGSDILPPIYVRKGNTEYPTLFVEEERTEAPY